MITYLCYKNKDFSVLKAYMILLMNNSATGHIYELIHEPLAKLVAHKKAGSSIFSYLAFIFIGFLFLNGYRSKNTRTDILLGLMIAIIAFTMNQIALFAAINSTCLMFWPLMINFINIFLFNYAQQIALIDALGVKYIEIAALFFLNGFIEACSDFWYIRVEGRIVTTLWCGRYDSFTCNMALLILTAIFKNLREFFSGKFVIGSTKLERDQLFLISLVFALKNVFVHVFMTLFNLNVATIYQYVYLLIVPIGLFLVTMAKKNDKKHPISFFEFHAIATATILNTLILLIEELFSKAMNTYIGITWLIIVGVTQAILFAALYFNERMKKRLYIGLLCLVTVNLGDRLIHCIYALASANAAEFI
ncbi:hypothetical protein ECANGB1_701 [Enterospora canceri]|uniref:Uncharacterized protein n=1 Tax=Enterospora canceri TaxID=1081671 RepID=A0A1Y1S8C8_9MICR|nr:hypothetical protein ECANGB1_701 [Enterospora canceri]